MKETTKKELWFCFGLFGFILLAIQSDYNWYQIIRIMGVVCFASGFFFYGRHTYKSEVE